MGELESNPEPRLALFQRKEVRRVIHNTEWWFSRLAEADVVLFVASLLEANRRRAWYPRTLIYSGYGHTCELFTRAISKRFFENLRILFGVASKEDFTAKIEEAFKLHRVDQWSQLTFYSDVSWNTLLNFERLGTVA